MAISHQLRQNVDVASGTCQALFGGTEQLAFKTGVATIASSGVTVRGCWLKRVHTLLNAPSTWS
jgi:hypothetical protein